MPSLENEVVERIRTSKTLRRLNSTKNFNTKLQSSIELKLKNSWFHLAPSALLINLISKRQINTMNKKIIPVLF